MMFPSYSFARGAGLSAEIGKYNRKKTVRVRWYKPADLIGENAQHFFDTPTCFLERVVYLVLILSGTTTLFQSTGTPMTKSSLLANQAWSLDFVADQLSMKKRFRCLAIVDVFTRECLATTTKANRVQQTRKAN